MFWTKVKLRSEHTVKLVTGSKEQVNLSEDKTITANRTFWHSKHSYVDGTKIGAYGAGAMKSGNEMYLLIRNGRGKMPPMVMRC